MSCLNSHRNHAFAWICKDYKRKRMNCEKTFSWRIFWSLATARKLLFGAIWGFLNQTLLSVALIIPHEVLYSCRHGAIEASGFCQISCWKFCPFGSLYLKGWVWITTALGILHPYTDLSLDQWNCAHLPRNKTEENWIPRMSFGRLEKIVDNKVTILLPSSKWMPCDWPGPP